MTPYAGTHGPDRVGALGGQHQREPAPMQNPTTPIPGRPVRRASSSTAPLMSRRRALHRKGHHLLGRLVGLGERYRGPVVEVGGEGGEPGSREPVAGVDLGDESPPLLDHDDAGAPLRPAVGHGDIAMTGASIFRKSDQFTHARRPYPVGVR